MFVGMHKDKCICDRMYKGGQHYFQNRDLGKYLYKTPFKDSALFLLLFEKKSY